MLTTALKQRQSRNVEAFRKQSEKFVQMPCLITALDDLSGHSHHHRFLNPLYELCYSCKGSKDSRWLHYNLY